MDTMQTFDSKGWISESQYFLVKRWLGEASVNMQRSHLELHRSATVTSEVAQLSYRVYAGFMYGEGACSAAAPDKDSF